MPQCPIASNAIGYAHLMTFSQQDRHSELKTYSTPIHFLVFQPDLWTFPLTQNHSDNWCNKLCDIHSLFLSLSLHFNGHFPGEPGSAGAYWSKGRWRWWWQLDYWSCKSCQAPANPSPPTNHILQAGCLSCCPTNTVKALKGKISHSMDLLTPSSLGVFQLCLWPLIAPGYLGEVCHASHQPSDASTPGTYD